MKDFLGKELHVGDEVIFTNKGVFGTSCELEKGRIIRFEHGMAVMDKFRIFSRNKSKPYRIEDEEYRAKVKSKSIYKI